MLTVSADPVVVESQLEAGELACPSCGGLLGPWGWARRRQLGRGSQRRWERPRRSRCRSCAATHVLLPVFALLRRLDLAGTIGRALSAWVAGGGQRPIAAAVGVARSTLRGWLARFAARAGRIREHFTRWALWTDPSLAGIEPAGTATADAVAVVVAAAQAAGWTSVWRFAAAATGGRLLCNTSAPFPAPWPSTTLPSVIETEGARHGGRQAP